MQLVGRAFGSVAQTWNSINPAYLSGAIDVVVVQHKNGDLNCSPFHVRFGKFSSLRPYEKKVEVKVNGVKIPFAMKLGESGEAFFVFETTADVPEEIKTSPLVSPESSPQSLMNVSSGSEPEYLELGGTYDFNSYNKVEGLPIKKWNRSLESLEQGSKESSDEWSTNVTEVSSTEQNLEAILSIAHRVKSRLDRELQRSNIFSTTQIFDNGDIILDPRGSHANETETYSCHLIAKRILREEVKFDTKNMDLISRIDPQGKMFIFGHKLYNYGFQDLKSPSSNLHPLDANIDFMIARRRSDPDIILSRNNQRVNSNKQLCTNVNYAKTLRLTSEQLKMLALEPNKNILEFSVNKGKSILRANLYLWNENDMVVVSDIDGTITRSDALGHIMAWAGRDWTHFGVAKLYTNIVRNGYKILYLTSRSAGLAETTRNYLQNVVQDQYRLPDGPVILSPDRTFAALKREVVLKKPEVFKMACLRDILNLFGASKNPFFAGLGNRFTDALSYRSVGIPASRIFTINHLGQVQLELIELKSHRSSYIYLHDIVDHIFPPLEGFAAVKTQYSNFTDTLYWRFQPPQLESSSTDLSTEVTDNESDELPLEDNQVENIDHKVEKVIQNSKN